MDITQFFPPVADVRYWHPAEHKAAVAAYRTWNFAAVDRSGFNRSQVAAWIARLDKLMGLAWHARIAGALAQPDIMFEPCKRLVSRLTESHGEARAIPCVIELIADCTFMQAEATAAVMLLPGYAVTPQLLAETRNLFDNSALWYDGAIGSLDILRARCPTGVSGSTELAMMSVARNQFALKLCRATIRQCSYAILHAVAPSTLERDVVAVAPTKSVLELQRGVLRDVLSDREIAHVRQSFTAASAVFQGLCADAESAAGLLVNCSTLAMLCGDWKNARMLNAVLARMVARGDAQHAREDLEWFQQLDAAFAS